MIMSLAADGAAHLHWFFPCSLQIGCQPFYQKTLASSSSISSQNVTLRSPIAWTAATSALIFGKTLSSGFRLVPQRFCRNFWAPRAVLACWLEQLALWVVDGDVGVECLSAWIQLKRQNWTADRDSWHCGLLMGMWVLNASVFEFNRRSSEIQGTALGKCLQAYIYRSRPAGVAQSRHAFVGGTVSTWARWRIPVNKGRKGIRNADQVLTVHGEHADRIVGSPSW